MSYEELKQIAQRYKTEIALLDIADNLPEDQADAIRLKEQWGSKRPKIRLAAPHEFSYGMRTDDTDTAGLMRCEFHYRVKGPEAEMQQLRKAYDTAKQTIANSAGVNLTKVHHDHCSENPFYQESWKPEHRDLLRNISDSLDAVVKSLTE